MAILISACLSQDWCRDPMVEALRRAASAIPLERLGGSTSVVFLGLACVFYTECLQLVRTSINLITQHGSNGPGGPGGGGGTTAQPPPPPFPPKGPNGQWKCGDLLDHFINLLGWVVDPIKHGGTISITSPDGQWKLVIRNDTKGFGRPRFGLLDMSASKEGGKPVSVDPETGARGNAAQHIPMDPDGCP